MNKKFIYRLALVALAVCVFFLISKNTTRANDLADTEKPQLFKEIDLQSSDEDESRSVEPDRAAVRNSELNVNRRRLAASKEKVKAADGQLAVSTKVNAIVYPGESLITLDGLDGKERVVVTALTLTVEQAEDGSDIVVVKTRLIEAGEDLVTLNEMSHFQDTAENEYQYVEAWSAAEYEEMTQKVTVVKGINIATLPSIQASSAEMSSVRLNREDGSEAIGLDISAEIQDDGSIHIQSELRVGAY